METNRRAFFGMLLSAPLALIPGTTVKFEKRLKRPTRNVFRERAGVLRNHIARVRTSLVETIQGHRADAG